MSVFVCHYSSAPPRDAACEANQKYVCCSYQQESRIMTLMFTRDAAGAAAAGSAPPPPPDPHPGDSAGDGGDKDKVGVGGGEGIGVEGA